MARKPSDEINPETGMPYEDIPGLSYPPEFEVAESMITTKPQVPLLQSAVRSIGKQVGRDFEQKAIDNFTKVPMPTRDQMWKEALKDPNYLQLMNSDFAAAQKKLYDRNLAAAKDYSQFKSTVNYDASPSKLKKLKMPE